MEREHQQQQQVLVPTTTVTASKSKLSRDQVDEVIHTTLSWTSSNVSLSPENPPFHTTNSNEALELHDTRIATTAASHSVVGLQEELKESLETTTTTTTTTGERVGLETETAMMVATGTAENNSSDFVPEQKEDEVLRKKNAAASASMEKIPVIKRATTVVVNSSNAASQQLESLLSVEQVVVNNKHSNTYSNCSSDHPFEFPEDEEGEPVVDESLLQSLASNYQYEEDDEQVNGDHYPVMLEYEKDHSEEEVLNVVGEKPKSFLPQFHTPSEAETAELAFANSTKTLGGFSLRSKAAAALPPMSDRSSSSNNNAAVDEAVDQFNTNKDEFLQDEDDDDDFLQSNSLLRKYHHGRQPSTIAEEFSSESLRKEDDEFVSHREQRPLLTKQLPPPLTPPRVSSTTMNRPLSEIAQETRDSSTGSFGGSTGNGMRYKHQTTTPTDPLEFRPFYTATRWLHVVSRTVLPSQHVPHAGAATWIGFWAMLHVTCANYVLTPMRDAIALQVGVKHIPQLTLASTVLAVFSSVPIGWLFEAPDPGRRRLWKRMGLTRGETQGTSLALFYRFFAFILISYAVGFQWLEWFRNGAAAVTDEEEAVDFYVWFLNVTKIWASLSSIMYIAFFLVVHLMKLHCLSLVWGVTTEAMEYEEVARKQQQKTQKLNLVPMESQKMRLKRLSLVGFGGTLGGIVGSFLASSMAQTLRLPGLLLLAACMLEVSAELSIELGRIMQKHWEGQQQLFQSSNDLASLDPSMVRSSSLGSMKRISSGNSLNRVKSTSDLGIKPLSATGSSSSLSSMTTAPVTVPEKVNEDTFSQRMLRGVTTILRSRLLMAIFTYNALYASTTVLLSFQRAALIASRNASTTVQADTAFLANINMASSAAIFALQASGVGAFVAHRCGSRGTLALMPLIRLLGVLALAWWHRYSNGQAPNLLVFLVVDECCKIMNLAVAKPVRESLWRGLSNEARYEAKPIVDTLANRWGGGSAAFLVSFVDKTLDLFGGVELEPGSIRTVLGFPPVLFLCVFISAWWAVVSADLGQIRKNIDLELKKRQ